MMKFLSKERKHATPENKRPHRVHIRSPEINRERGTNPGGIQPGTCEALNWYGLNYRRNEEHWAELRPCLSRMLEHDWNTSASRLPTLFRNLRLSLSYPSDSHSTCFLNASAWRSRNHASSQYRFDPQTRKETSLTKNFKTSVSAKDWETSKTKISAKNRRDDTVLNAYTLTCELSEALLSKESIHTGQGSSLLWKENWTWAEILQEETRRIKTSTQNQTESTTKAEEKVKKDVCCLWSRPCSSSPLKSKTPARLGPNATP